MHIQKYICFKSDYLHTNYLRDLLCSAPQSVHASALNNLCLILYFQLYNNRKLHNDRIKLNFTKCVVTSNSKCKFTFPVLLHPSLEAPGQCQQCSKFSLQYRNCGAVGCAMINCCMHLVQLHNTPFVF